MTQDAWTSIIGTLGLLGVILVGLGFIVRGLMPKAVEGSQPGSPVGSISRIARAASGVLSVAVIYRYYFAGYSAGYYSFGVTVALIGATVLAMALFSYIEVLVSVAALGLFLAANVAEVGISVVVGFFGVFLLFVIVRVLLGR